MVVIITGRGPRYTQSVQRARTVRRAPTMDGSATSLCNVQCAMCNGLGGSMMGDEGAMGHTGGHGGQGGHWCVMRADGGQGVGGRGCTTRHGKVAHPRYLTALMGIRDVARFSNCCHCQPAHSKQLWGHAENF